MTCFPFADEAIDDLPYLVGLPPAFRASSSGLALEVVDENEQMSAVLRDHLVLRAIPREHDPMRVLGIDVRSNRADREPGLAHDPDVDAAWVIAVNEHDVPVLLADELLVEAQQRRSILCLDDRDDLGIDTFVDDLRGHPRAGLVDRLLREFDPADPAVAAVRDDLHVFRLVLRLSVEAPRFFRSQAHRGDDVSFRRIAPCSFTK
jgi:hypothetical protein